MTVVGGYLGSGKTTLINHLLRHADGLRLAVLVNEFGSLPIDADLIESEDDNVISIAGGCVCCSYGNDLMMAMIDLVKMEPRPDHVLIEASGVALPGSIAASISLISQYTLEGVLVLSDVETIRDRARDTYLADTIVHQLADADLIVLNKTDLVAPDVVADVRAWLSENYDAVKVLEASHARLPLSVAIGAIRRHGADRRPMNGRHVHDQDVYDTESFPVNGRVDVDSLARNLASAQLQLIRAKGFAKSADGTCHAIQVVGRRSTVAPVRNAPATGLVCIGINSQFSRSAIRRAIDEATAD